jgi:hypothetical protein
MIERIAAMSDSDDGGWWDRVRKELNSPWDWVAAGVGATGGLIVSAAVLHSDMGASVGAGALGTVTAKKAGVAAWQRPILKKRTRAFIKVVEETQSKSGQSDHDALDTLLKEIRRDLDLLDRKVIAPEQYNKIFYDYIERFRQLGSP